MDTFIKILKEKGYEYVRNGGRIVVTHKGDVFLDKLKKLSKNITFANGGDVDLGNLKKLPGATKFANKGDVFLDKLKELPETAKFANSGGVYLRNLKKSHENKKFIVGKYTIIVKKKKSKGNFTICNPATLLILLFSIIFTLLVLTGVLDKSIASIIVFATLGYAIALFTIE